MKALLDFIENCLATIIIGTVVLTILCMKACEDNHRTKTDTFSTHCTDYYYNNGYGSGYNNGYNYGYYNGYPNNYYYYYNTPRQSYGYYGYGYGYGY